MEISDSSSEDECNIYVNAASKLNALNRRAKYRFKDNEDDDDDDGIVCTTTRDSPIINDNKVDHENTNNDCAIKDLEENPEQNEDSNEDTSEDDVVVSVDVNDFPSSKKTRSTRTTRNSNKRNNITAAVAEPTIVINDSMPDLDLTDQDLNLTYDDSLQLSQDENDCYVIIGSPPPAKKTENSDNHEVSVKVMWKSNKVERFDVRRYETFQKIFKYFANLESVHEDQILIMKKDRRITPFDTPMSINLSIIDILDGGVVSAAMAKKNKKGPLAEELENTCKIKIQSSDKQNLTVTLKRDQTFAALVHSCSEQLNIPEAKMKFYFDGEIIDIDETPESLDIDDEACFDLKISK